jgi:deoxyadenosine/deoxycytidine kinase
MNQKKKIIIEGNIGSGKTTLIDFLKSELQDVNVVDSEFSLFHPNLDYNIIKYSNEDPKEWTFLSQVTFMKLLNKIQNKPFTSRFNIFNRSIYSVQHVFNQTYRDEKYISDSEYKYLTKLCHKLLKKETISIDILIFFSSDVKTLESRSIDNPFKHFIPLFQRYYDTLLENIYFFTNIKSIYVIDSSKPKNELIEDYREILKILIE